MTHKFLFQYQIPADNQPYGEAKTIDVFASWDDEKFYSSGKPMVYAEPINLSFDDYVFKAKNWYLVYKDINAIADDHFAALAKQQRIEKAKAELAAAGEFDNPVLERYENNPEVSGQVIHPFFNEIISNHFTPVS